MKNSSFWEKETLSKPFDLVIIGAGIVGLSSALFYKQQYPGRQVVVLEKGWLPEGASTRNAGFACFGSVTELLADLEYDTEENIKRRIHRRYCGMQLLRETLGDDVIGFEPCGGDELFTDRKVFEETTQHLPEVNHWFFESTGEKDVFEPMKLNERDVIYSRLEGALHPGKLMQTLINKVQSAGIDIKWNSKVIKTGSNGSVHLENGCMVRGDQILLACNGFSKVVAEEVDIQPARGMVMVSEPWLQNPWKGIFHYDCGFIYFRNIGGRLLLGGGRNVAIEEEQTTLFGINSRVKQRLLEFVDKELGFPSDLSFEYEWSGIMGFTPAKAPIVRRIDDHRSIAAGLSGMGIAIGMDVAKEAVQIIAG